MPDGWIAPYKVIRQYRVKDDPSSEYIFKLDGSNKSNIINFQPDIIDDTPIVNQYGNNVLSREMVLEAIPLSKQRALIPSDTAGPRYRKIALNGVPISDAPPEATDENDVPADETYVDAYSRALRHSVTDVWSRVGASEIPLSVRRTSAPEIWSWNGGLRPNEHPDRPFGAGFSSNLTASITFTDPPYGSNQPYRATAIDENGSGHSFVLVGYPGLGGRWVSNAEEKQDAKTCYDQLTQVSGGWELRKKFGTVCYYEMTYVADTRAIEGRFGGRVSQIISADRVNGSDADAYNGYEYGRLRKVIDRLGNELVYDYPNGNTLIPNKIYDPDRPNQILSIEQNADGRVVAVRGPAGDTVYYQYAVLNSAGIENDIQVLTHVKRGEGEDAKIVQYTHDYDSQLELDADPTSPTRGSYGYVDLKSITDERGYSYDFEYEFASQMACYYSNGYVSEKPWMKRLSGIPKLLKTIVKPNGQIVSFTGDRTLEYQSNGEVNTQGIFTRVSSLSTGAYTYAFTEPSLFCPVPLTADSSQSVMVSFTKMSITSAAGTEQYEFDPDAGMALKRIVDISGRVTSYTYDDSIAIPPAAPTQVQRFGVLKFDDPTTETNALKGVKHYEYEDNFRLLTRVTDELGASTKYDIDPVTGLRTRETVIDASNETLRSTRFEYEDEQFAGFMTARVLETTGLGDLPAGMAPPIGEMRTEFIADVNGRVAHQIVYAGGEDNPATESKDESLPLITSYTYTGNGSKSSVIDPRGQTTQFEYEADTLRLKKVIYPDLTFKSLAYDDHGNLVEEVNEMGVKTFHDYDNLNRRVKTTVDLNGNGAKDGRYTMIDAPGTANSLPIYNGDLVSETTYNDFNLPEYETDARGIRTLHKYDGIGRRVCTTVNCDDANPNLRLVTRYVDENPDTLDWIGGSILTTGDFKPLRTIDPRGFVTEFEYDAMSRPTRTLLTDTSHSPPQKIETQTVYDAVGNPISTRDPLGRVTTTEYDGLRRAIRITLPSAPSAPDFPVATAERTMKYTPSGLVWSSTDELGYSTYNFYDGAGRVIVTMQPGVLVPGGANQLVQPQTWQAYDEAGNVIAKSDPLGNITETEYDERNRPKRTIFPEVYDAGAEQRARPETLIEYDDLGRVVQVTDPLGRFTSTRYDHAGRAYAVIAPQVGAQTQITLSTHDAAGQVLTVTNPGGQTITNTYDNLGRLGSTEDHAGIVNQFAYDQGGNRVLVRDGEAQVTEFTYDAQSRLLTQVFANGDAWSYRYNATQKIGQTDANGVASHYQYDVRDRLCRVSAPDLERLQTYDASGRLLSVVETGRPEANVAYTYDAIGRLKTEVSQGVLHTYGYDVAGNRVSAVYGTGRTVTTDYDALNRPETIHERDSTTPEELPRSTAYQYDLAGHALVMELGNGQVTKNSYDELGRLTHRTIYASGVDLTATGVLTELAWTHDAVGNVTQHTEQWHPNQTPPVAPRTTSMTYDGANRLLTETISDPAGAAASPSTTYTYDRANNRTSKTVTGGSEPGHWTWRGRNTISLKGPYRFKSCCVMTATATGSAVPTSWQARLA